MPGNPDWMRSSARWIGVGAAIGVVAALVPLVQGHVVLEDLDGPLRKLELKPAVERQEEGPDLSGLDLLRLKLHPRRVTTRLSGGRTAELTLDPVLQRTATSVMRRYNIPEAGAVLMDVESGRLLVYASHVEDGKPFDVNARAEAPAASVFKVVTAAALVEQAGLTARSEQCYRGGRSQILADELREDPKRDKWCASLAAALGRSINVVFGRLAQKHLTPETLAATAGAFGFGAPVPFVVPNETPKVDVPADPLEFARTAAGFWHTSLSPLAGASLAQSIANHGVTLAPRILSRILNGREVLWKHEDEPKVLRRAVSADTAEQLTIMMVQTVENGSGFESFHDRRKNAFLPGIDVAGKTGTLTRHKENRLYTWFVGFAPAEKPEVAVSVLVVNTPVWRIKGPALARDVLRAYFAKQGRPGVTSP